MDYEDWFFHSIRQYKNLSMYDLQQDITCMDMVDGKSICVATASAKRNEIMELMLPDKMIDMELEARLKKDRDFRVNCGGFCEAKMSKCRHIPKSRYCAVTLENKLDTVDILQMGTDNTDLMKPYRSYTTPASTGSPLHLSSSKASNEHLTFGSSLNNVTVVDIHSEQPVHTSSECTGTDRITAIHQDNPETVTCCTVEGNISRLDFRCSKVKVNNYKNSGKSASFWTISQSSDQSNNLLLLSSEGEIVLLDSRCPEKNITSAELQITVKGDFDNLHIQESSEKDKFSVSGFDGLIYVFDYPIQQKEENSLVPIFTHEGHMMECENQLNSLKVVNHLWHPWQKNLIISCANNGTIHAWQYNE